ncbi:carbohydrate ABC transporter permease [Gorillibacterium sp. sgz5001074]|uniref:carbohydrate ABC transporter permease n=1 Tax=Gorillibacterium sp. sgz5001074 TaxID=3446695 RepID=UPI003F663320
MGTLLKPKRLVVTFIMLLLGMLMIVPFLYMISFSLKTPLELTKNPASILVGRPYFGNFATVFTHKTYFIWYFNSFKVVLGLLVLRGLLVTMAAYAFARLEFRLKNAIFLVLLAKMMIPSDTTIVARFLLYKYLHLNNTHWVLILPAAFDVFFLFLLRQFFIVIPREISEAAIIDGCSHYKVYYRIILPLAKPALVTMVLFTFLWTWNDFASPFVFITDMKKQLLTVGLSYFQTEAGADYSLQMAGAAAAVVPTILLFIFTQKYFVEGVTMSGVKG